MKIKEEAINYCLRHINTYKDYPFGDKTKAVLRHIGNNIMFALIYSRGGYIWINVKREPETDF